MEFPKNSFQEFDFFLIFGNWYVIRISKKKISLLNLLQDSIDNRAKEFFKNELNKLALFIQVLRKKKKLKKLNILEKGGLIYAEIS